MMPSEDRSVQSTWSCVAGLGFAGFGWLFLSNSEEFLGRMVPGTAEFAVVVAALFLFGMAVGWRLPDGGKGLVMAAAGVLVVATLLTSDMAWLGLTWIAALAPMLVVGVGWLFGRAWRKSMK